MFFKNICTLILVSLSLLYACKKIWKIFSHILQNYWFQINFVSLKFIWSFSAFFILALKHSKYFINIQVNPVICKSPIQLLSQKAFLGQKNTFWWKLHFSIKNSMGQKICKNIFLGQKPFLFKKNYLRSTNAFGGNQCFPKILIYTDN